MTIEEMLDKLLEFEGDDRIVQFRFKESGLLMWPFVRYIVYERIYRNFFMKENILGQEREIAGYDLKGLVNSYLHFNPLRKAERRSVLFCVGAMECVKDKEGYYYNRIFQPFFDACQSEAVVIERDLFFRHLLPRRESNILYKHQDMKELRLLLDAKIKKLSKEDTGSIAGIMTFLKENLPYQLTEEQYERVREILTVYAKGLKNIQSFYRKLIAKYRPRLVIVEDGCYGEHIAIALKTFNDMGIVTAEVQHGLIGRNHLAYNLAEKLQNMEEYRSYLPGYFLSFGKYWEETMRIPCKKVTIGSANCNLAMDGCSEHSVPKKRILIMPGVNSQIYVPLVEKILTDIPGVRLTVKLHPNAGKQKVLFERWSHDERVRISNEGNINDYFAWADYVTGDGSTALYEAAARRKRVFVYGTEESETYIDKKTGVWFTDAEDFLNKWNTVTDEEWDRLSGQFHPEDYFAPDPGKRFLDFVQSMGRNHDAI